MSVSKIVLQTERCVLRRFIASDAENLFLMNSDLDVMKFTGDKPFDDLASAIEFIESYDAYERTGMGRWAVVTEKDGFIGWCGLKQHEDYVDLGFRFMKNQWGKGYATETAKAVIHYAFSNMNIDRIIGRVASENKASIRVLEKLGMQYWKKDTCKGIQSALYFVLEK